MVTKISMSDCLICFLAVVVPLLLSSPVEAQIVRPPPTDCANVTAPNGGDFLSLLQDMEALGIINKLDASLRVFPYEVLTAAETGNLNTFLGKLGYLRVLIILDGMSVVLCRSLLHRNPSHHR